jgi:hypothetical protein
MPNHCCNTLVISADAMPIILKNYIGEDKNGEKIFDFERIEPIGDIPDWYKQRNEKWGTKWVGYDLNIGETIIDFFTAWSPPLPIIKKLAELHKDFVFRLEYYEAGMAFRGIYTASWNNGEVLAEDDYWDMTDKDFEELGLL